jgi:hypothetical protein
MKPVRVEDLVLPYLLCIIRLSQHRLGNRGKGYFLRYGYSVNSESPLETSSPGAGMNPSLPPVSGYRGASLDA